MITGYHDRSYPGFFSPCNRLFCLLPRWIDHPDDACKYEIMLNGLIELRKVLRSLRKDAIGNSESSQRFARKSFGNRRNLFPALICQRLEIRGYNLMRAACQEYIRSSF